MRVFRYQIGTNLNPLVGSLHKHTRIALVTRLGVHLATQTRHQLSVALIVRELDAPGVGVDIGTARTDVGVRLEQGDRCRRTRPALARRTLVHSREDDARARVSVRARDREVVLGAAPVTLKVEEPQQSLERLSRPNKNMS